MIDRLNFFDFYGYLLPGGFLMVILWLPFGVVSGKWPSDLAAAILGLVLAYIVGQLLRIWSSAAISSDFRDSRNDERKPSDLLLDQNGDRHLPSGCRLYGVKNELEKLIKREFNLDTMVGVSLADRRQELDQQMKGLQKQVDKDREIVAKQQVALLKEICERRNDSFFKCRSYLISRKAPGTEQLQGMYELMRGLATALALAFALYLGLGIGLIAYNPPTWILDVANYLPARLRQAHISIPLCLIGLAALQVVLAFASFRPDFNKRARLISFVVLILILCLAGAAVSYANGQFVSEQLGPNFGGREGGVAICAALLALALSAFCCSASRAFAATWAITIYREFSYIAAMPKSASPGAPARADGA